jgi:hypothetical protein
VFSVTPLFLPPSLFDCLRILFFSRRKALPASFTVPSALPDDYLIKLGSRAAVEQRSDAFAGSALDLSGAVRILNILSDACAVYAGLPEGRTPLPVPDFRHVLAVFVDVQLMLDELVLHLLLQVGPLELSCGRRREA